MVEIEKFEGPANKERLLACIRGEQVDRVPHFEIYIENDRVKDLLGREAGNTIAVGGDPAKGADKEASDDIRPMHAKDYIEICQMTGQDAIAIEQFWTPIKKKQEDGSIVPFNDKSFRSASDLDKVIWPDESDMEERLQYFREYINAVKGTDIGVAFSGACIFQFVYEFMIGFEDAMVMALEEPDLFKELMLKSARYFAGLTEKVIAEGVDFVYFADDFGFKTGLFLRPGIFKELWVPYYEMILAPVKQAGVPIVFHSCGKIDEMMDTLIEMGIQGITPLDPSGIDYRDYKKRYGDKITLFGNMDITFPLSTGTPEDVEKDVKEHMDALKPGGRWVAGSSHSIGNIVPHDNFITMINAIHKYGAY